MLKEGQPVFERVSCESHRPITGCRNRTGHRTGYMTTATTMAADKLAAERSAGIQAANAISAQAAGMTLPASLQETTAVPVVNTAPDSIIVLAFVATIAPAMSFLL